MSEPVTFPPPTAVGPFQYCPWESQHAPLPYYRGVILDDQELPHPHELPAGIYVARGMNLDRAGWHRLPGTIDLWWDPRVLWMWGAHLARKRRVPLERHPTLRVSACGGEDPLRPELVEPFLHQTADIFYPEADLPFRGLLATRNRLYHTLPYPAALTLMEEWVENLFTGRRPARIFTVQEESPRYTASYNQVGFLAVTETPGQDGLVIDLVGIIPQYRGCGVGRMLLGAAMDYAWDQELPLSVRTEQDNSAALALYRGAGFRVGHRHEQLWCRVERGDGEAACN